MTDARAARRERLLPVAVFGGALLLYLAGLSGRGLWINDEHRYAEVARVMTESGADRIVPHLNGRFYPDKPPLFFWIGALFHGVLGMELSIAVRLTSVLAAAGAVSLTFAIGRRLYSTRAGLAAAVVLATFAEFGWLARRGNLDALLTFFATLGFWGFARTAFPKDGDRGKPAAFLAITFLALGVGALVKSPHVFLLFAGSVTAFALWVREPRRLRSFLWGVPLAALPVVVWLVLAWRDQGLEFVHDITVGQWVKHPAGLVDKQKPFWVYFKDLPVGALPWTLMAPAAILAMHRRREAATRRADRFVICWIVVQFVGMSLITAKRDLYLLPLLPGVALLLGRGADLVAQGSAESLRAPAVAFGRWSVGLVLGIAGAAMFVAAAAVLAGPGDDVLARWEPWTALRESATTARLAMAVLFGTAIAVGAWSALRASTGERAAVGLGVAAIGASLAFGVVVLPVMDPGINPRAFVERVRATIGDAPLADYGGTDFAANWMLRRDVVVVLGDQTGATAFFTLPKSSGGYLACDRRYLESRGMPPGASIVLVEPRALDHDLVLLRR